MSNEVINTVQVQAAAGRSDELGRQLQKIVDTLRETPGLRFLPGRPLPRGQPPLDGQCPLAVGSGDAGAFQPARGAGVY